MSTVVILSGGLDSTTLLYKQHREQGVDEAVTFNYGQKQVCELLYAARSCDALGIKHTIINLGFSGLVEAIAGSNSLMDEEQEIPDGKYSEESISSTVVPNRNMMMISIAGAIAVARGSDSVSVGIHGGDHAQYPDTTGDFLYKVSSTLHEANRGMSNLKMGAVEAPFVGKTKEDIAVEAIHLGVPLTDTWSCYRGDGYHCGRCGTCVDRLIAIDGAYRRLGLENKDRTVYLDSTFWREQVK